MSIYFVQIGVLGVVGRFSSGNMTFNRSQRVVCQTSRGLETGVVLSVAGDHLPGSLSEDPIDMRPWDGRIVRPMNHQDELIAERLEKNRHAAIKACERLLVEQRLGDVLVDAELLFDGQNLFFYFLGEIQPETEVITEGLAETYEAKIRLRKFSEVLANGCGPDCGTRDCSSGNCSTCALGGGCASKN